MTGLGLRAESQRYGNFSFWKTALIRESVNPLCRLQTLNLIATLLNADIACEQWDSLCSVPYLPVDSDTIYSSTKYAACIFRNGQKTVSVYRKICKPKEMCRITTFYYRAAWNADEV